MSHSTAQHSTAGRVVSECGKRVQQETTGLLLHLDRTLHCLLLPQERQTAPAAVLSHTSPHEPHHPITRLALLV